MHRTLIILISFCLAQYYVSSQSANKPTKTPMPVIFDTDIGPDYDDVGAMALLHAFADNGECRILATIASNKY